MPKQEDAGSGTESSYYDDEEESEGEQEDESLKSKEPKTQEVIDVTGNMSEK